MGMRLKLLVLLAVILRATDGVDETKFRRCDQTRFCASHRQLGSDPASSTATEPLVAYMVPSQSVRYDTNEIQMELHPTNENKANDQFHLRGRIVCYASGAVRLLVEEKQTRKGYGPRWTANKDILQHHTMTLATYQQEETFPNGEKIDTSMQFGISLVTGSDKAAKKVFVLVTMSPFSMAIYVDGSLSITTNKRGFFHYQTYQNPNTHHEVHKDSVTEKKDVHGGKKIVDYGEDGLAIYEDGSHQEKGSKDEVESPKNDDITNPNWEEKFGDHVDKNPYGPSSVGIDIEFVGTNRHLYGLPEHATNFALKDTTQNISQGENSDNSRYKEPYRLYNLDVFEYELDVPMALYGAIPVLLAHNEQNTVGIYWNNPTETFVDIYTAKTNNGQKYEDFLKGSHWISESGVVDIFFLTGDTSAKVFEQYSSLTGFNALPPMFALGYHQCRWNYKNELDVKQVNSKFDEHIIPYDVLWLDIEHTDGKRYFTWDKHAFPDPVPMQDNLARVGRKMVTIIDPHIKRDDNYLVHQSATKDKVYVKNGDNFDLAKHLADPKAHNNELPDFDGWCWPGSSSYIDFTSEKARSWWAEQFALSLYKGSTRNLYTWNDMNEPSVFNGPEVSMTKTHLNYESIEHRQWHNLYGYYMHQATTLGHIYRQDNSHQITHAKTRPFVLSRSFFAGSQRFGAIWTGDNLARWDHLQYATKMLLSMSVAGLPFVGADVGGFFGNPSSELLVRWNQAACYQPFFRGHAHHDSKRREPWVLGEPTTSHIRTAIRTRYTLLPYIYTLFYQSENTGMPVMRPLWVHFPKDTATFALDGVFMLGEALLIQPIVQEGQTLADVYLPHSASDTYWYALNQGYEKFVGGKTHSFDLTLDSIPVFQLGGTIVPRRLRTRRSSSLMTRDPFTLYVAIGPASSIGQIYLDDESTFAYRAPVKSMCLVDFQFDPIKKVLLNQPWDKQNCATLMANRLKSGLNIPEVERIVFMGLENVNVATLKVELSTADPVAKSKLTFHWDDTMKILSVRKPNVAIASNWQIEIRV